MTWFWSHCLRVVWEIPWWCWPKLQLLRTQNELHKLSCARSCRQGKSISESHLGVEQLFSQKCSSFQTEAVLACGIWDGLWFEWHSFCERKIWFRFSERERIPSLPQSCNVCYLWRSFPMNLVRIWRRNCGGIHDSLPKSFGTREKLDYCLAYAGAAWSGSKDGVIMFHVGIGGSGETTFTDWIQAG